MVDEGEDAEAAEHVEGIPRDTPIVTSPIVDAGEAPKELASVIPSTTLEKARELWQEQTDSVKNDEVPKEHVSATPSNTQSQEPFRRQNNVKILSRMKRPVVFGRKFGATRPV